MIGFVNRPGSIPWWRRPARNRLLDLGLGTLALVCVVRIVLELPTRVFDFDFNHSYVSSRLLLEGKNPYTISLEPLSTKLGFAYSEKTPTATNPPGLLWLFLPLALLTPRVAFIVWVGVQFLSLVAILWLIRLSLRGTLSVRGWRLVCFATLISEAVYWNFHFSHVELPLAAAVIGGYVLQQRGKHAAACLVVAAAGLLKLYPWFLLPWFLWRGGGSIVAKAQRTAAIAVFVLAGILATRLELWRSFLTDGMRLIHTWSVGHTFNFSLPSFVMNLGYARHEFSPSSEQARCLWLAGIVVAGAVACFAYLCCRKPRDSDIEFSLLCAAMVAASVTAWGYYFVFLIFPVTVAALRLAEKPSGCSIAIFGLMLFALNNLSAWQTRFLNEHIYLLVLAHYLPLYGLIGLIGFLVYRLRAGSSSPHSS